MSQIELPPNDLGEAPSVAELLTRITDWKTKHRVPDTGYLSRVWYRGHSKRSYILEPGVYRGPFTRQAKAVSYGPDLETRRLNLERVMLQEFRTVGATFLDANQVVPLYFTAQHYGMPTRLLDWTANPLAALFFAVIENDSEDGDVIVMEPTQLIPKPKPGTKDPKQHVRVMRDPYATDAIGVSFWHEPREKRRPLILPIRPDNQPGRIGQQSSLFTLHMHLSTPVKNPTLERIKVPAGKKSCLREELRNLNINEFTIYNDLDHLSKEIKRTWGV